MNRKFNRRKILEYLTEYLILSLKEISSSAALSKFGEGEMLAYVECLEILSKWSGFKKFGIVDIEKYFNIN